MTQLHTNVGAAERVLSMLGGFYLWYDSVASQKTSLARTFFGSYLLLRGATGFCLAYRGLGKTDVDYKPQNINIRTSLTVNRPRDQVYAAWRRLDELPHFMSHLKRVDVISETLSEWEVTAPGNIGKLTWRSEIVKDDPGAVLSWHSLPGSSIENAGKVTFSDAPQGTEIDIVISYHAPLGMIGEKTGRLLNPIFEKIVREDIRNFKEYIETGMVPGPRAAVES